jgi:hypothetical protein
MFFLTTPLRLKMLDPTMRTADPAWAIGEAAVGSILPSTDIALDRPSSSSILLNLLTYPDDFE